MYAMNKKRKILLVVTLIGISILFAMYYNYSNKTKRYNSILATANEAINKGDYDQAINLYNEALTYKKDNVYILKKKQQAEKLKKDKEIYDCAIKEFNDKNYIKAIEILKKINKDDSKFYSLAQSKINECTKIYIQDNLKNANKQIQNGKFDEANKYLGNVLKIDPNNEEVKKLQNTIIEKKKEDLNKVITFKDEWLERSVLSKINQPTGNIHKKDVENITALDAGDCCASLEGIENLTNLQELTAIRCPISDITPLQNLTKLKKLEFYECELEDISPLKNLTQIEELCLDFNEITNISSLRNMAKLKTLSLCNNNISNLTPLSNLIGLEVLDLRYNPIANITSLSKLINLKSLNLSKFEYDNEPLCGIKLGNPPYDKQMIRDISPLKNLINLEGLNLSINEISDITPLSNLTKLQYLCLSYNKINDVSSLQKLTNLERLELAHNPIEDTSPIEKLNINELILNYYIDNM